MIVLPKKFEEILNKDSSGYYVGAVKLTSSKFDQIFSENRLYFFEEYTDHGIRHINSVLKACANLITPDTYNLLTEKDISILVLSVFLHDLGMHLQPLTFKKMVTGGYDDVLNADFGDQKWSVLWDNYLFEAKKFNDQQRINIFGDADVDVTVPDLNNPDLLTGIHRKLIGEFIRRHHPRIAFEVAFKGLAANDGTQIDFCSDFDFKHKLLAGLLARSHGMNIRDTFHILEKHFTKRVWRRPINVHIVYLMALIRLADYFQIDASRVLKVPYLTRQFKSPVSFTEHQKHLQTTFIQETDDDPETLYITAEPTNSVYFLALERLFKDIQYEVDNSWAVLGEVYGSRTYEEQPKLAYRRIRSNIDDKKAFEETVSYVPEQISFTVDKEVPKLLVGPLYDYDPTYGVRELLQNAVDACWEREFFENKTGSEYKASILVKIEPLNDRYLLSIKDNGKGMTLNEIQNFFLKIGGSFRKSETWQHDYVDMEGHSKVNKSGRFGIGVLAAYLLGAEIEVKTKSIFSSTGYCFNTTLDQKQVEILKEKNLDIGTVISIVINQQQFNKLIDNENTGASELYLGPKRFNKWYVLKSPEINYQICGPDLNDNIDEMHTSFFRFYQESSVVKFRKEMGLSLDYIPGLKEDNIFWHELVCEDYKKIVWSYYSCFSETLICNGFIIQSSFKLSDSQLQAPTILIFDFDAKLPINLNRTLVNKPLTFDNKLEVEIYKDIVAAVLLTEVDNIFTSKNGSFKDFVIGHPGYAGDMFIHEDVYALENDLQLILGKAGFFLNHPSVCKQILGLNYLRAFKYDDKNNIDEYLDLNYLFENSDVDLFSLIDVTINGEDDYYILEEVGKTILSSNDKNIMGITYGLYSQLPAEMQKQLTLERNLEEEFLKSDSKGLSLVYYKQIEPVNVVDTFGEILSEFLGDDLLIPYAIEDRKKKFPKAFKELEPYMRKYLKGK